MVGALAHPGQLPSPKIIWPMIGIEFLREAIETTILTGKLTRCEPVSLLLIAAPESGKTSVVLSKDCTSVEAYTDVTGRGLHEVIKGNKELTHIVINDMVALLSHKESVNRYTLSQLNAITEEGITAIATPKGIEKFTLGKRGIITSLTLDLVKDSRRWWNQTGFSSRMLPFCYCYRADIIVKIKAEIDKSQQNGFHKQKRGKFLVPAHPLLVKYPDNFLQAVRTVADVRSAILKEQGFRRLKQYHAMTQAHALLRSRASPSVNSSDVEFIRKFDLYVSYDKPEALV